MSRHFSGFSSENKSTRGYRIYDSGSKAKDTSYIRSARLRSTETDIYGDNDMEIELVRQAPSKAMDLESTHSTEHELKTAAILARHPNT